MAASVLLIITGLACAAADSCGVVGCDPCTPEDVANLQDSIVDRVTNKTLYPDGGMDEACVQSAKAAKILGYVDHKCSKAADTLIAATKDCDTYFDAYVTYCSGECGEALRATHAAKILAPSKPAMRFTGTSMVPLLGMVIVVASIIIKMKPFSFETSVSSSRMPVLV